MSDNPIIFIAIWTHKHGEDVGVYKTAEGAEKWRQTIANEWWKKEMGADEMPADPRLAADAYFDALGEDIGEFFCVYHKTLED